MSDALAGIGLALVAAAGFAASALFARLGLQYVRTTTGVLVSIWASLMVVTIVAVPFYFDDLLGLPAVALFWLFLIGLVHYPMGRFFKYTGVRLAGVARASPLYSTSSLFAVVIAIAILGESPSLLALLGTLAIVVGVVLVASQGDTGG